MHRHRNEVVLPELKRVFEQDGARPALAFLNSLSTLRFTSLYRFEGETLRNITFFDRERPDLHTCEDIPVLASYCVFVRETRAMFSTCDANNDNRVKNHPKRETIQAYCGVPLLGLDGKMFGSACHFDFKPGSISDADVELLEFLAILLQAKS